LLLSTKSSSQGLGKLFHKFFAAYRKYENLGISIQHTKNNLAPSTKVGVRSFTRLLITSLAGYSLSNSRSKLLAKPHAGSRCSGYNNSQAKYYSNCHGTIAYLLGLKDPILKVKPHPIFVSPPKMEELLRKYFLPSDGSNVGEVASFYYVENSGSRKRTLSHTALLIENKGKIFHQTGSGESFETSTVKAKLRGGRGTSMRGSGCHGHLEVKYYRLKRRSLVVKHAR